MYDSRSSHAHKPRSAKALSKYLVRRDQEQDGAYFLLRPVPASTLLIDEGVTEYLSAPIDLDERFTVRECMDQFEALDQWHDGDDLRMADWEVALETGIEQDEVRDLGVVWTTASNDAWIGHENLRSLEREAEEDEHLDELLGYESWLAPVSTAELFDLFPDGGFTIEGPSAYEPSGKADAHMRAHELALLVGIDTARMIDHLRVVEGEWVAGPLAYVALPVCQRMVALTADLRAEYGARA